MDRNIESIESAPAHMAGFSSRADYLLTQQEAEDRNYAETTKSLMAMVAKGDANAVCNFAPTIDWARTRSPVNLNSHKAYRAMTLAEVLGEALDCIDAPSSTELMQLVLNGLVSTDTAIAAQSKDLIDRMVKKWANTMTGEVA